MESLGTATMTRRVMVMAVVTVFIISTALIPIPDL